MTRCHKTFELGWTACPEPFSPRYFFFVISTEKRKKKTKKRYGLLQLRELPHIFDYTDDGDRQIDIKLYSYRRRCLFFFRPSLLAISVSKIKYCIGDFSKRFVLYHIVSYRFASGKYSWIAAALCAYAFPLWAKASPRDGIQRCCIRSTNCARWKRPNLWPSVCLKLYKDVYWKARIRCICSHSMEDRCHPLDREFG